MCANFKREGDNDNCPRKKQMTHAQKRTMRGQLSLSPSRIGRDSSPTRQLTDMHFEVSSPTELMTIHRQNLYCIYTECPKVTTK